MNNKNYINEGKDIISGIKYIGNIVPQVNKACTDAVNLMESKAWHSVKSGDLPNKGIFVVVANNNTAKLNSFHIDTEFDIQCVKNDYTHWMEILLPIDEV